MCRILIICNRTIELEALFVVMPPPPKLYHFSELKITKLIIPDQLVKPSRRVITSFISFKKDRRCRLGCNRVKTAVDYVCTWLGTGGRGNGSLACLVCVREKSLHRPLAPSYWIAISIGHPTRFPLCTFFSQNI